MGLEDCEEVDDDIESRVQLDPSVWASKERNDDHFHNKQFNGMIPPENFMPHLLTMPNAMNMPGPSIGHPFQQQQHQLANQQHQHMLNASRQVSIQTNPIDSPSMLIKSYGLISFTVKCAPENIVCGRVGTESIAKSANAAKD